MFRAIYFLLPLAVGLITLLSDEAGRRRSRLRDGREERKKGKSSISSAQAA
jgi:hypothetical protein